MNQLQIGLKIALFFKKKVVAGGETFFFLLDYCYTHITSRNNEGISTLILFLFYFLFRCKLTNNW